jgi:signal transduction histidine kinase
VADFVWPAHRRSLDDLLAAAASCALGREASYVSVLHAHGDGGHVLTGWQPLEIKACASGDATYLAIQDARVPANMESRLSNLLLYTSACPAHAAAQRADATARWSVALLERTLPRGPAWRYGRASAGCWQRLKPTASVFSGHDLRTPCASIQAAAALLRGSTAVAADGEALSLLRTADAACAVLLRCVGNLLGTQALQQRQSGDADALREQAASARARMRLFDPHAVVERVLDTVRALDTVPPLLVPVFDPAAPLPRVALGDDVALAAAVMNVTLAALRMGAWKENVPVRLRIAAQLRACEPPAAGARVTVRVAAEAPPDLPAGTEVLLRAAAEAPGRPLTPLEVAALMAPYGLFPADKGGAIGLPLQAARALARACGGDLDVVAIGDSATELALSFALLLPDEAVGGTAALGAPGVAEGLLRLPPASWAAGPPAPAPELPPPRAAEPAPVPASGVAEALFHLLTNCEDIFSSCSVSGALDVRITYASPSLAWRMGTEPAAALGRSLVELVCHPEDQGAFCVELARARAAPDGRMCCTHRCLHCDGMPMWCRTVGVFAGDALYLVCRDVRPTKTAELALRAFTLAASAELREPCNTIAVALAVLARRPCVAAGDLHGGALAGQDALVLHAAELMGAMWASAQLIQGIIGNVVTVPQLEAGELALQQSVFSPAALIASVLQICRLAAAQQELPARITSVEGALHGLAPLPPLVEADRDRLAQICQCVPALWISRPACAC